MTPFRLDAPGVKKIAVIKAIRDCYRFDLTTCRDMVVGAPVELVAKGVDQALYEAMIKELRSLGARVTCLEPSAVDKLTASQFIASAQDALAEGDAERTRNDLRAALKLLGDF